MCAHSELDCINRTGGSDYDELGTAVNTLLNRVARTDICYSFGLVIKGVNRLHPLLNATISAVTVGGRSQCRRNGGFPLLLYISNCTVEVLSIAAVKLDQCQRLFD